MAEALRHALTEAWRDPALPLTDRVDDLLSRMTVAEKLGQLGSFWAESARPGEEVAPMPDDLGDPPTLESMLASGLGQLTRVFGTAPIGPADGTARLRELQEQVVAGNRFGIPAIAHEECLTGFMTWTASVFPGPLSWGATFDQDLVERMAGVVGATMARLGVHQGLAPVLDVVRDYRWGRTEESIGEDPQLVGVIGTAYARGLERSGVVATLKHFAGYSASRAGRNMAPAGLGPREFLDVIVEPFVMALRESGARAVMPSYCDMDGIPSHGDGWLLTDLLRDRLGFTGLVVADYYGISFLESMHAMAGTAAEAALLALRAGVDVELPTTRTYDEDLGALAPAELLDRAVRRVLMLKGELGLLDGLPPVPEEPVEDLDPPANRELARRLAEESIILLANDGVLPLRVARIALVGPVAAEPRSMLGCYSFPNHIATRYPGMPLGIELPSLADALSVELPELVVAAGTDIMVTDADIAAAVAAAEAADVCVLAVGDRSGLFGRGTSGEGCDATTLALPGRQTELAKAVLATGTPTVLVVISGRPYTLDGLIAPMETADHRLSGAATAGPVAEVAAAEVAGGPYAAAVVQAFLPGEEGGTAIAGVLTGRVAPSGRLPVCIPRRADGQPATYLQPTTGLGSHWSAADPTPLFPFGHGLSWTTFGYDELDVTPSAATDGSVQVAATVRNTGDRAGTEVVQLYLSDPVASVVRPARWLAGWARVELEPGAAARVEFTVHADRTSFTGRDLRRIVEPGEFRVGVGSSSADLPLTGSFVLDGPEREPGADRVLTVPARVTPC